MIKLLSQTNQDVLACLVTGKVEEKDYEIFNPALEQTIRNYKSPKMYLEVQEMTGFDIKAAWEDFKNIPDYNKFEKVAVVGDKAWIKMVSKLFDPIIEPQAKYFDLEHKKEAMDWLKN
jgi:hypothetical protein